MKLIYCYIENFRGINNLKLNLSSTHDVTIEVVNGKIHFLITKQPKCVVILPDYISDVSLLIGKNGTGKTRILDLLSINRKSLDDEDERKSSYFMIYHVEDDTYYIEGNSEALMNKVNLLGDFETSVQHEDIYLSCFFERNGKDNKLLSNRPKEASETSIIYLKNTFYSSAMDYEQPSNILVSRKIVNINRIGYYHKYSLIKYLKKREGESNKLFNNIEKTMFSIQDNLGFTKVFKDLRQIVEFLQNPNMIKRIGIKYTYLIGYVLKVLILYITRASNENKSYRQTNTKENSGHFLLEHKVKNIDTSLSGEEILRSLVELFRELFVELDVGKKLSLSSNFLEKFNHYISNLITLNEEYFTMKGIEIPMFAENKPFSSFLQWLDKLNSNFIDDFKISISTGHLSAGEETFLNLFTSIYSTQADSGDMIILLDEPDSFMHPEWCRRLMNELFHFIEEVTLNKNQRYQIILSTHSPFLSSDLPSKNVIPLDYHNGDIIVKENGEETFANNIHKLLFNKFFLESTIGEFASEIIDNRIIEKLNGDKLEEQEINETLHIIELIGEPVLRKKLHDMLIPHLTEDPIEQEILRYEKKLKELKKRRK
ncbi:AAA family ATPase [Rossellomorea sp. YZS02]|uniref:AAA family ATPase n=1 Tax=Rossellomorea sp. YZS02 TaxID=3097358 RepID=UPI002A13707B|nr:AAA family ATPase [Rossellomorea sp. YZS02]MDX8344159.1 AAA family ATPase [Rossellomorea sp. YZS02]